MMEYCPQNLFYLNGLNNIIIGMKILLLSLLLIMLGKFYQYEQIYSTVKRLRRSEYKKTKNAEFIPHTILYY